MFDPEREPELFELDPPAPPDLLEPPLDEPELFELEPDLFDPELLLDPDDLPLDDPELFVFDPDERDFDPPDRAPEVSAPLDPDREPERSRTWRSRSAIRCSIASSPRTRRWSSSIRSRMFVAKPITWSAPGAPESR